jgi:hypothetical protein
VVLLHADIADDVVVSVCILARPEIPWFLLGVVWPALQTFQFVLKVENVEGLLIS